MGDFLWINKTGDSKSLTSQMDGEHKAIHSFVQRRRLLNPDSENQGELKPHLHRDACPDPPEDDKSKSQSRRRIRKSAAIPEQVTMQARWRLDRPARHSKHWMVKDRQTTFRKDRGSLACTGDSGSTNPRSYGFPWRGQSDSESVHLTGETERVRDDVVRRRTLLPTTSSCQIQSYFGAGRVDPFSSITDFELPAYGHEVLDYAINSLWPSFAPMKGDLQRHPIKRSWLDVCRSSPMVFFTFLFGAAENQLSHRGGIDYSSSHPFWRLRFHSLAITYINDQITRLSTGTDEEPSDELLACILTLAVYGAQNSTPLSKSESALRSAQTLDVVSHREHVQAHKDALFYLVAKKGGLSKVKMFGISVLLQAIDLVWSTLEQRPPRLPWSQGTPILLPLELQETYSQHPNDHLATGFFQVSNVEWPLSYTEVFTSIRRLIIALHSAQEGGTTETYLQELVAYRNWIQHCLLSLTPTIDQTPDSPSYSTSSESFAASSNFNTCTCTLEISRLSMLILSTFIIFPIPSSSKLNVQLNDDLLKHVDCCIGHQDWNTSSWGYAQFVAWASMLGAINCSSSEFGQRTKFTALLAFSSECLGIWSRTARLLEQDDDSWREMKDVLGRFLWWDSALGGLASVVWEDVRLLRRIDDVRVEEGFKE